MSTWRDKVRVWWRTETGSEVAQAAAVALMAVLLIGGLVAGGNQLGPKTQQALACLASTLGGGGGGADCAGAATPDQASTQTPAKPEEKKEEKKDCGLNPFCHAGNFIEEHGEKLLDGVQVVLDVGGLIPGLGEPLDLLNGTISLARGNYVDAALSYGSAIPFAGWGATAAKWGKRGVDAVNAADALNDTRKGVDRVNDVRKGVDNANDTRKGADNVGAVCPIGGTPGRSGAGLARPALAPCKVDITDPGKVLKGKGFIENPNRPGSWGKYDGKSGKYREYWRYDKAEPGKPGWRGKDHVHHYGGKEHLDPNTPFDPDAPFPP